MRAPDATLVRARAKAPLADLQALHLSSADLANLRNLDGCRRLRSLYANANVLKDIDGLLSLRCLWRIDLSDNLVRQLRPLASFPALGFLHLERNQLDFDALVCLRDVHILDLRLGGNTLLLAHDADRLGVIEYRMKIAALLPYAWTLDGHYVTTSERAEALEVCDDWVVHMLGRHTQGADAGALRFGSTAELWGGVTSHLDTRADDDAFGPVQEQALSLLEAIATQPTRNPEHQDLFRLRTIATFHDNESSVHNAHTPFAPHKHMGTAKPMPAIRLKMLQALPRRVRLELGVLLAMQLDFPVPAKLLTEALTLVMLSDCEAAHAATWVHDLASLPPYAVVALVSVLRLQALEDDEKLRKSGVRTIAPLADSEHGLWSAMPAVHSTLLRSERQSRLEQCDAPDPHFLQRCAFAVSLLSRAAAFPPKPSPSSHGELYQLTETAKLASNASLESLEVVIPSVLVGGDSSSSTVPWKKTKKPDRKYRKPWSERPDLCSPGEVFKSQHGAATLSTTPKRRLPKPGEWLEVSAKCFFKIRSVSPDGGAVAAAPATDTTGTQSALITLRLDQIARMSSSMWRLTADEPHIIDEITHALSKTPHAMKSRLGKLHRDSHGFHKHGASHNQGFPNHDVSTADLRGVAAVDGEQFPTRQPQAVEVFSATDTLDANYVLTSPALIHVQNAVATRSFHEQRREPAGLWNPIEAASFQVTSATDNSANHSHPIDTLPVTKQPKKLKRNASLPSSQQPDDDWLELQRDMQLLLGIRPRTPLTPVGASESVDAKCFLTAVPVPRELEVRYDLSTCHDSLSSCSSPAATTMMKADEPHASVPRSTAKPRKLEALAWHQVATKPQLLVAAASPVLPPRRASATGLGQPLHGAVDIDGGAESRDDVTAALAALAATTAMVATASMAPGARPSSGALRTPLRLTRCHVSLPSLSSDSQR